MQRSAAVFLVVALSVGSAGLVLSTNVVALDGDGIPAAAELQQDTDPLVADTDRDGLPDGEETAVGSDPTVVDTDGDGLDDGVEVHDLGTNATVADTDGDGLDDGDEVYTHGTAPMSADSDHDGLNDSAEIEVHGTDPVSAHSDSDDLADLDEIEVHGTDPTAADTDGDGLDDDAEVYQYRTGTTAADTDGDGLDDGEEVEIHGTDPTAADTDGDGLDDGAEVGHDALDESDPFRMDIYVEVDYVEGYKPPADALDPVTKAYAAAPISNPDGSTGIRLHISYDEAIETDERVSLEELRQRYMPVYFDHEADGYHYGIAVGDARHDGRSVAGVTQSWGDNRPFLFETARDDSDQTLSDDSIASTFMHELGHSNGIRPNDYDGVDSKTVSADRYESTMNYNAPDGYVGYNDGAPFDDWAHIEHHLHTPAVRD
ncbi:hypothetical protein ACAH01_15235 [Halomicrobium sp. HM KBTZ05]|uniref:hypothetical protein n=1 Tax=Halomicrobium sp. HM KBTZ05 TaxID=3242663 RepID=UPI0035564079